MKFHLGDILSITHDRLVSPTHMDGIYAICNYLTQDSLFTHQLPRVHAECKAHLLSLHPQLNRISTVSDGDVAAMEGDWWVEWLQEQVEIYGEHLDVTPIPAGIHEYKNPIEEAIEMVGEDRLFVLKTESGD